MTSWQMGNLKKKKKLKHKKLKEEQLIEQTNRNKNLYYLVRTLQSPRSSLSFNFLGLNLPLML